MNDEQWHAPPSRHDRESLHVFIVVCMSSVCRTRRSHSEVVSPISVSLTSHSRSSDVRHWHISKHGCMNIQAYRWHVNNYSVSQTAGIFMLYVSSLMVCVACRSMFHIHAPCCHMLCCVFLLYVVCCMLHVPCCMLYVQIKVVSSPTMTHSSPRSSVRVKSSNS